MAFQFASSNPPFAGYNIINAVFRFMQFILAITVIGLYGAEINGARKRSQHLDGLWIYGEVVATLSAITCIVFVIPKLKSWRAWPWDLVLLVLWIVIFAISIGVAYHQDAGRYHYDHPNLYSAVWVNLANFILWFVTATIGVFVFWRGRKSRSTFTGRAVV